MRKFTAILLLLSLFALPALMEEKDMKTIYFAGGCFWGTERLFELVPGVQDVVSGYANGTLESPSYERVIRGDTGHRETVKVTYDPKVIGLKDLMRLYYATIEPELKNRQGNDIGTQYQTGIYWEDAADAQVVLDYAEQEKPKHRAFHVELQPLSAFWEAEEYHQDYLVKNPNGYCHIGPAAFEEARKLQKLE